MYLMQKIRVLHLFLKQLFYSPTQASKQLNLNRYLYNLWASDVFTGTYINAPSTQLACSLSYENNDPDSDCLKHAFSKHERSLIRKLFSTLEKSEIPGDVVEFGVAGGNHLDLLVSSYENLEKTKQSTCEFYGFDSFEGLPTPDYAVDMKCFYEGQFASQLETVSEKLRLNQRPYLHLVKGWFADTLKAEPAISIKEIAYARIDCDLYQPTVESLDYLTSRLADGAILVFDDWGYNLEIGETRVFYEWQQKVEHLFNFKFIFYGMLGHLYLQVFRKNKKSN